MKLDASVVRRGFALLAYSIRTAPKPFAVGTAGAALYAAMIVASAKVFEAVTDRVILPAFERGSTTTGALAAAAGAIVGVAVLKAAGIVARRVGASYMQYALQAHVRRAVTGRYQQLPLAWHQQRPVGELLSRAHSDVEAMFWLIAPLPLSIGVVFLIGIAAVVLLATDVVLTVVALLLVPAIGLLTWRYNRLTVPPATRSQELRAAVAAAAHESFDGALVVKTLGRERAETDRFRERSDELRDVLVHLGRLKATFDPVVEGIPHAVILLVLLVGALRAAAGAVTAGDVVGISFLLTLLAFPIRIFGYLFSEMPRSVVGWDRTREVTEAEDALPYGEMELPSRDGAARVDVLGLRFAYDEGSEEEAVLRDIELAIRPGRTVALVGPTGAGKSTIASLLVRLVDPQAGSVSLDELDVRELRAGVVTRHAALVLQETFLFADTVRENITLGGDYADEEIHLAAELAQAAGFIEQLPDGYDTAIGERGATLSGGQRQRLALARALIRRPRLLILDDATSSVDPRVEGRILHGLGEADLPATVVLVASRVATIELADEVVFLDRGRVRARGTHRDLLDREPGYRRLIEAFAVEADDASSRSA